MNLLVREWMNFLRGGTVASLKNSSELYIMDGLPACYILRPGELAYKGEGDVLTLLSLSRSFGATSH